MSRRVATAHASAQPAPRAAAPTDAAATLGLPPAGEPDRVYRIRHRAAPPYDWELELEAPSGELAWRLPRGLPWAEGELRDALPAPAPDDDLPLWDDGRYRTTHSDERRVVLELDGRRVRGRYAFSLAPPGRWRLERLDPATVKPMPERVLPMLAHSATYPDDPAEYAFEPKWDGIRALAHVRDGRLTIRSRSMANVTDSYPDLAGLAFALTGRDVVLDGEIVALEDGRPSFQRLQARLGVVGKAAARKIAEKVPVSYVAFDLLHLDGQDLTGRPYEERRAALESLELAGDNWCVSPVRVGEGRAFLELPGWEGVVAKRLGSPYEPGARSRAWLKIKQQRRQELLIVGWTPGRGARAGRIGSLLTAYWDVTPDEAAQEGRSPRLLYAGSVGTGFTDATLEALRRRLEPLRVERSPLDTPLDRKGAVFVEPRLVGEFEFLEWTREGRMRHPSFKGLREDKDPRLVVREEP